VSELETGAAVDVTDDAAVEVTSEAAETPDAVRASDPTAQGEQAMEDEPTEPTEPTEPEVDPRDEFRDHLQSLPGDWYVVHSYAGYENRVKHNLENRRTSLSME